MTQCGHKIAAVEENSPASRAGISAGDMLIFASGEAVEDYIDYLALTNACNPTLGIRKAYGEPASEITLVKREGEPLGLSFEGQLMGARRLCANKCVFCFVDQNPPNARETLRVKDDDWRESLMMGNYVTLTNVSDAEFDRILKRRVAPLYLSVHTFDSQLRAQLLGRKRAAGIWERLRALSENGLGFHAQIVLCPGINDGAALTKTLNELEKLPMMLSTAVVPVGLTAHRQGLCNLTPFNKDIARDAILRIEKTSGGRIFAADELYILADMPLPKYEAYGDFPQIENGVGMIRLFEDEFLASVEETSAKPRAIIVTGEAAAPFMTQLIASVRAFSSVSVLPVKSRFFGGHVNVAGLVTGLDIVSAFKERSGGVTSGNCAVGIDYSMIYNDNMEGKRILLPESMLKDGEVFLDDMPLVKLKETLGIPIEVVPVRGDALWEALIRSDR